MMMKRMMKKETKIKMMMMRKKRMMKRMTEKKTMEKMTKPMMNPLFKKNKRPFQFQIKIKINKISFKISKEETKAKEVNQTSISKKVVITKIGKIRFINNFNQLGSIRWSRRWFQ